ncbi:MAG: helix-turn-helix transcriptional regulator [Deltaproteobacteria bacterium]|nr:helix-turn-helix transcriptional regulator [Candidatus Anaeroferrophillus wilburensis]MBN2888390.1 helix-turn-helix transcriptional regulator [Deltaproteobacteria bacterium]
MIVNNPDLKQRAAVFKALAHPTRLFIIDELAKTEQCVCKLTEMIGADTSTVSRHLSVLKNAGIVDDEKRGLQVFYSLKTPCIIEFFTCVQTAAGLSAGSDQLKR